MKNQRAIKTKEIAHLLKQLAALLASGVAIIQSCKLLEAHESQPALSLLIRRIQRHLSAGHSLWDSIKQYPHYFDDVTCHLVNLGEQTGQLDKMLLLAAHYHEKNESWKQRIIHALFYPSLVMGLACCLTLGLILLVIPQFATLFQEAHINPPVLTTCIFKGACWIRHYFLCILFAVLCISILLHHQKIKLPILKSLTQKIALARFTRHLALTLSAGIPLSTALTLANPTRTPIFCQAIRQIKQRIQSGTTLHQAMASHTLFPASLIQMVKIGEEGGILEEMVNKFTDIIELDTHHLIERFHLILEPFIMIMLGIFIGGLIIGMYLPLFQIGKVF